MFDSESDEYKEPQERSTKRCQSKYSLGHFVSGAGGRVLDAAGAELMPLSLFAAHQPCIPNFIPRVRLRLGSKFSSPHASCSG
jgi:hypothetical protein